MIRNKDRHIFFIFLWMSTIMKTPPGSIQMQSNETQQMLAARTESNVIIEKSSLI